MFRWLWIMALVVCSLTAQVRINAGGPALTDILGRSWTADAGAGTQATGGTEYAAAGQTGIYSTLRFGNTIRYDIPTDPATQQLWWIRLHFLEPSVTGKGQRIFDVYVDNTRMVSNLDLVTAAGFNKPYAVSMVVDSAKKPMSIELRTQTRSAVLSGIEARPFLMAQNGVTSGNGGNGIPDPPPPPSDFAVISNPAHAQFFGKILKNGSTQNPWPYIDSAAKVAADNLISVLDTKYAPFWDVALGGTIDLVNTCTGWQQEYSYDGQCATVTGHGTSFQQDFCSGGTQPNGDNTFITIWYRSLLESGKSGRRNYPIKSCDSATQMTLGRVAQNQQWSWITWPDSIDSNTAGLQYGKQTDSIAGAFNFGNAPFDYYDNVVALYYVFWSTGDTKYLDAARKVADRWWVSPGIDRGALMRDDTGWWNVNARSHSVAGLILRALDGRPEMWPGIRRFLLVDSYLVNAGELVWDARPAGYEAIWLGMGAMFDPDPAQKSQWYQIIQNSITNKFDRFRASDTGIWNMPIGGIYSFGGGPLTGNVTLTQGSASVAGSGTNFTYRNGDGCDYMAFYPLGTTSQVDASSGNTALGYGYKVAAIGSDSSITLTKPWAGQTGQYLYGCTSGWLGSGVQPFMSAIMARGFDWYHRAAVANNDPVLAAKAKSYILDVGNYIKDYTYMPAIGGTKYGTGFPVCEAPDPTDQPPPCPGTDGDGGSRITTAEVFSAYTLLYQYTDDPVQKAALKSVIDARYNVLFAKPGTATPNPDPRYLDGIDSWMVVANDNNLYIPKWFGFFQGITRSDWPSARVVPVQ